VKILLSPHNDDESLFAAHLCIRERPCVIVCLRSHFQESFGITAGQREAESTLALLALGCEWEQWEFPDIAPPWPLLEERLRGLDAACTPETVYAPAYDFAANGHAPGEPPQQFGVMHHDYVGWLAHAVFGERARFYQTYTRWGGPVQEGVRVRLTPEERRLKQLALSAYASQIGLDSTGHHFSRSLAWEWLRR
jgi:LmbE family N-acetylglucosaminyl deacetylase